MERVPVIIADEHFLLCDKQIKEISADNFPSLKNAILSNVVFREQIGSAFVYYILDRDRKKIVIVRDDSTEVEKIIKKAWEEVVKDVESKFGLEKIEVKENVDGIYIAGTTSKVRVIRPSLLPPIPVQEYKEVFVKWEHIVHALVFAVKLYFVEEKVEMLYEVGKSIREIADELGMQYEQVRSLLVEGKRLRTRKIPREIIVELAKMGVSSFKIAKVLNLNEATVSEFLRKEGIINGRKKKKVAREEIEKIVKMYKVGVPVSKIAKELKRSKFVVYYYLKKRGLK